MAEAVARCDAFDVMEASSAGVFPLGHIPALTAETLAKNGYSADGLNSKAISPEAWADAEIIINMSGSPRQDAFREFAKVEDWMVSDPYGANALVYQTIFESIRRRVRALAQELRQRKPSAAR
jgi:protein-tyrosine-phosphatase